MSAEEFIEKGTFFRYDPCCAAAVTRKDKCIFKVFPSGKDKFGSVKNNKTFAKLIKKTPPEKRTFQEVLLDGKPLFPYWDLDMDLKAKPDDLLLTRKNIITSFHSLLEIAFQKVLGETFKCHFMMWSDSSGPKEGQFKVSLHCVYIDPEISWKYNRAKSLTLTKEEREKRNQRESQFQFASILVEMAREYKDLLFLQENDDNIKQSCIIDTLVYSTNRAMRSLYCHKPNERHIRILRPIDLNTFEICDVLCEVGIIKRFLIVNEKEPKRFLQILPNIALIGKKKQDVIVTRHLLDKLAQECGCTVHQIKGKLVTLKTNPKGRVDKISGEHYSEKDNHCYFLLQDGKIIYKQHGIVGEKILEEYSLEKDYQFYHDVKLLRQKQNELGTGFQKSHIEQFIKDVVLFCDKCGDESFIVKVNKGNRLDFGGKLPVKNISFEIIPCGGLWGNCGPVFLITTETTNKKGERTESIEKIALNDVVREMAQIGRLRTFYDVTWVPYCISKPYVGYNCFNTFQPFPLKCIIPPRNIPPFKEHAIYKLLRVELTKNDPICFEYVLSYLAHKLQNPEIRMDTALAFVRTSQGIGKSQFGSFISALFSSENVKTASNLEHVFSNFNSHLQTSLFLILEEVQSQGKSWSNSDRLKDLISSTEQIWEAKFKTPVTGKWYGQVIVFSNNSYGLKVETTDRRYVLCDTQATLRNNKLFHDKVAEETKNSGFMSVAFHWFLNKDVTKFDWRKIPETNTREVVKRASESIFMKFTRWLFSDKENFLKDNSFVTNEEYNKDFVEWKVTKNDISITTYNRHIGFLFRHCRDTIGLPTKLNETSAVCDGLTGLWQDTCSYGGRYKTERSRGARNGIKIESLKKLQTYLSDYSRSNVEFGCWE